VSQLETVRKIIVHCSDSDFGDAKEIDRWHKDNGWRGIGYHYVILSGHRQNARAYVPEDDGIIEPGRDLDTQGAHVYGHNNDSIGICLIGRHHFTTAQLFQSLPKLLIDLIKKYGLQVVDVLGRYELDVGKTCPNLPMNHIREFLKSRLEAEASWSDEQRTG
jgi:N-acetylmuramoyl-L-alanine amidase